MSASNTTLPFEEQVALLADVADSRRLDDFPSRRDRILDELSRRHRERGWTQFDYAVTAWDEFQGLLHDPAALPRVVWDIWRAFGPISLRLAVGIGTIERAGQVGAETPLNEAVTGPAFFLAREALHSLARPPRGAGRVRIRVAAERQELAETCNAVLRLADALAQDITDRQWEVIDQVERDGAQDKAARSLGVSPSTISRALAGARHAELQASLAELEQALGRRFGDTALDLSNREPA
jgi:hypothetical protein